jgi:glycosyltransferase involved in cell wall biosynthesis
MRTPRHRETRRPIAVIAACPFPTSQGSQVLIHQLSRTLAGLGHPVHVVAYHFGEPARTPSFRVHRIPRLFRYTKLRAGPSWRKPILDFLLACKAFTVARRHDVRVLHAHNYEAAIAAYLVRAVTGIPVVYHSHNAMTDELPSYFSSPLVRRLAERFGAFLDRQIPRRADYCIAINEELAEFLQQRGVSGDRCTVLPPGSFPGEFVRGDPAPLRRRYELDDRLHLIYTGNLDAYQDLNLLFASVARLHNRRDDFRLLVVSHCDPRPYEQLARDLGISSITRFLTTNRFAVVADLLALSDLAVMPRTSWSGFPIKLINYMAAGKAILVSAGSAKNIIHQHNGWIVPNDDVDEWVAALDRLLGDPELRRCLARNARATAIRRHNWARIGMQIEAIYSRLDSSRRSRRVRSARATNQQASMAVTRPEPGSRAPKLHAPSAPPTPQQAGQAMAHPGAGNAEHELAEAAPAGARHREARGDNASLMQQA